MRIQKYYASQFNRTRLPSPLSLLNQLRIYPGKTNSKGYWLLQCPFHKDGKELKPSFNLHHLEGHYRCHACGVKGRDILQFYRQVTGASFIEAAIALGVWEDK